jgi:hypothetical protein
MLVGDCVYISALGVQGQGQGSIWWGISVAPANKQQRNAQQGRPGGASADRGQLIGSSWESLPYGNIPPMQLSAVYHFQNSNSNPTQPNPNMRYGEFQHRPRCGSCQGTSPAWVNQSNQHRMKCTYNRPCAVSMVRGAGIYAVQFLLPKQNLHGSSSGRYLPPLQFSLYAACWMMQWNGTRRLDKAQYRGR